MTGLLIVLFDSFSDFCSCDANDRIGGCIVIGCSPEYFDTQGTFFQEVVSRASNAWLVTNLRKLG